MWRVSRGGRQIVLVGVIEGVSKDTRWSPASLETALARADRLVFPDTQEVAASPFAMIGLLLKWRRQGTLPNGVTLAQLLSSDQFARLAALQRRGLVPSGFERRHPLHLALALRARVKGSGYGPDGSEIARCIARRHRIAIVPLHSMQAKPLAAELFGSPPSQHVPCLMAAVSLAEAGPTAVRERSNAWAQQRVAESLGSVAETVYRACWPAGSSYDITPLTGLTGQIERLAADSGLTVGVVSLASLGAPGGVLDRLASDGYEIDGPAWR